MGQVLIRNLDDEVIEAFRASAKANGRSLEAELRDALRNAAPSFGPDRAELMELSRRLRATSISPPGARQGWELVREDRDGYRFE